MEEELASRIRHCIKTLLAILVGDRGGQGLRYVQYFLMVSAMTSVSTIGLRQIMPRVQLIGAQAIWNRMAVQ